MVRGGLHGARHSRLCHDDGVAGSLIIDGNNVMGSRADGWWRDREGAARRLVDELGALTADGTRVAVVFDGPGSPDMPEGERLGVIVFYAGRSGRDAADDRIVELVEAEPDPGSVTVVTSDRDLRERVTGLGAACQGARTLLDDLEDRHG